MKSNWSKESSIYALLVVHCLPLWACLCTKFLNYGVESPWLGSKHEITERNNKSMRYMRLLKPSLTVTTPQYSNPLFKALDSQQSYSDRAWCYETEPSIPTTLLDFLPRWYSPNTPPPYPPILYSKFSKVVVSFPRSWSNRRHTAAFFLLFYLEIEGLSSTLSLYSRSSSLASNTLKSYEFGPMKIVRFALAGELEPL